MSLRVGIIGGTGFETALAERFGAEAATIVPTGSATPVEAYVYQVEGGEIVFIARHGAGHSIPPHRIDHAANLAALQALGVQQILSTSAVGSLKTAINPGDLVIPDDFIDLRAGGPTTIFADTVVHTDFSEPFSLALRGCLHRAAANHVARYGAPGSIIHPAGVYLCVSGPRYETPAEVRLYASWGADIVGMTVAPEAILSKEMGMAYASLSIATNLATGLCSQSLSHGEVEAIMAERRPLITAVVVDAAAAALAGC